MKKPGVWDRGEYRAGYQARLAGSLEVDGAEHCWHLGWQDADTELLESSRQRQRLDAGDEEDFRQTGADLYHVGGLARIHDFPFNECRTRPWKQGWVDADINVGALEYGN